MMEARLLLSALKKALRKLQLSQLPELPDGDALAYSISGGVDSDQFSISSIGALSFKNAPDFSDPKRNTGRTTPTS